MKHAKLDPVTLAALARGELVESGVRDPSRAALLSMARRMSAAGRGSMLGLHEVFGLVSVRLLVGELDGLGRDEVFADARVLDVDLEAARETIEEWARARASAGDQLVVVVRLRRATWVDRALAACRWITVRARVVRVLAR